MKAAAGGMASLPADVLRRIVLMKQGTEVCSISLGQRSLLFPRRLRVDLLLGSPSLLLLTNYPTFCQQKNPRCCLSSDFLLAALLEKNSALSL